MLNSAGVTGRPNVDWCDLHKPETIRANVVGTLNLAVSTQSVRQLSTNMTIGTVTVTHTPQAPNRTWTRLYSSALIMVD